MTLADITVSGVVTILLAASVPIVLIGGLISRTRYRRIQNGVTKHGLGIGWQFIRYTVLASGLPLIALLAINGILTGEVIAVFATAMGYAFGKSGKKE